MKDKGKNKGQPIDEREELQEWINTLDTIVAKYDPDGILLFCNEAAVKATGLTREEVLGRYFPDIGSWVYSEKKRAEIIECFEGGKERFVKQNRDQFHVSRWRSYPSHL